VGALIVGLSLVLHGQQAQAGAVVGSESLAGTVTAPKGPSADITTTGSVSFSGFVDTGGSGGTNTLDFQDHVPAFTPIPGAVTLVLAVGPSSFTITNAAWGTFTATSLNNDVIGTNTRTDYISGSFTPGTLFNDGETENTGKLIIAFTQAGGKGHAISASLTLTMDNPPIIKTPEPASFAILGSMGLVGLLFGLRRNRRAAV
jgi:hypothetical protein